MAWVALRDSEVLVEDGIVIRAMYANGDGSYLSGAVYERENNEWSNVNGVYTYDEVCKGIEEGRMIIS